MRYLDFLYPGLLAAAGLFNGIEARQPSNAVLLSKIESLTLRSGQKTTHRRVSAIPQLKCVGGNAKGLYHVDIMRCKNAGASYDQENPDWTCTAQLPPEFKLGSTDVICEGYASPDDPYILKGSCGVEYRLVLTERGEEKYGRRFGYHDHEDHSGHGHIVAYLFWMVFAACVLWIIYAIVKSARDGTAERGRRTGSNGGGGGGGPGDPPPPYDWRPGHKPYSTTQSGWRPGFWTGALGGGAAGYMAGSRANRNQGYYSGDRGYGSWGGGSSSSYNSGEGSSNSGSSGRYQSTGFGTTNRR